jgi:Protein of Unknown function (DUF2784)
VRAGDRSGRRPGSVKGRSRSARAAQWGMAYRLLGDAMMLAHFGFLVFVALGGFVAWRFRGLFALHAAAAGWGLLSAIVGVPCPLTAWEDRFRRLTGQQGLGDGFVGTYLTGVIYPPEHLRTMQLLVAALVVASWVGFARLRVGPAVRRWSDGRRRGRRLGCALPRPARDRRSERAVDLLP